MGSDQIEGRSTEGHDDRPSQLREKAMGNGNRENAVRDQIGADRQ
jgi:hypothetical protein